MPYTAEQRRKLATEVRRARIAKDGIGKARAAKAARVNPETWSRAEDAEVVRDGPLGKILKYLDLPDADTLLAEEQHSPALDVHHLLAAVESLSDSVRNLVANGTQPNQAVLESQQIQLAALHILNGVMSNPQPASVTERAYELWKRLKWVDIVPDGQHADPPAWYEQSSDSSPPRGSSTDAAAAATRNVGQHGPAPGIKRDEQPDDENGGHAVVVPNRL